MRIGRHESLISLDVLEQPRDGLGRPISVPALPALHRPIPVAPPEPIPSAPPTYDRAPERRPVVMEPDESHPAETPRPNDSPSGESVDRLSHVPEAPAVDRAAAPQPIPTAPRRRRKPRRRRSSDYAPVVRRIAREVVAEVAAMLLDALDDVMEGRR